MGWIAPEADLDEAIEELVPRLREIRHDLHRHPELGFEEHRTQQLVRAWLEDLGYEPWVSAQTGLIADLRPDLHGRGRSIALRADLDCLPMHEHTDLPYRSVHDGRAHKCGHDGHTAILMGAAAVLARTRAAAPGNVRLLFQPAEEGVDGGGAKRMVAEGALDGVAEVYGLHNWPPIALGQLRVCSGTMMAQTHTIKIAIEGVGGHASQPHHCRDPIVAAAQIVSALQTVVARGVGYDGGAVVSICTVRAGDADNIIPDRASLGGTVRTFSDEVTRRVLSRIREVVDGIASGLGVSASLELKPGYPLLVNDAACAEAVRTAASSVLGGDNVSDEGVPIAGAEDFAYFAAECPSAYFLLGAGDGSGTTPGCHHPDFDFDDALLPTGVRMFVQLASDRVTGGAA